MIGDALVFDGVAHVFNFDTKNALGSAGEMFNQHLYGSEAPIFHPQWALEAFWDFQLPQDLVEGYGYPQLTEKAKRKILGENLLRLHGLDPDQVRAGLAR